MSAQPLQVYVRVGECRRQLVPLTSIPPELQAHTLATQPKGPALEADSDDDDCRLVSHQPLSAQDLFAHKLLMLLSVKKDILAKGTTPLDFQVMSIDPRKPPPDFRRHSLKETPALFDPNTNIAYDHENEILEYLDRQYPTEQLFLQSEVEENEECQLEEGFREETEGDTVNKLGCELMTKFLAFVKGSAQLSQLSRLLAKLDDYLREKGTKWVVRDSISKYDIEMLPKLHQIRVACAQLAGYEIDTNLDALWRYLARGYKCPAFVSWAPSDQEIVLHYRAIGDRAGGAENTKEKLEQRRILMNSNSRFTLTVPAMEPAKEDFV